MKQRKLLKIKEGDEKMFDLDDENISLPYFKKNSMYNGMEAWKKYTLKELGLDV